MTIRFVDDGNVAAAAWRALRLRLLDQRDAYGHISRLRVLQCLKQDGWKFCKGYPKDISSTKKKYKLGNGNNSAKFILTTFNDDIIFTLIEFR